MINADRISRMISSANVTEAARGALKGLVEREEIRVGSRELAYELIAQLIGASSSWVKKFLARHSEVKEPRITLFLNIRLAYENACSRMEAENRLDEERAAALMGKLNAITAGFVEEMEEQTRHRTP